MDTLKKFAVGGIFLVVILVLPFVKDLDRAPTPTAPERTQQQHAPPPITHTPRPVQYPVQAPPPSTTGVIENAFRSRRSNLPVTEAGRVSRILSDDNQGSRHQRFIVSMASGHTVLIAHNIDIAPRINSLREGDQITFCGVYEWNDKGGVVHWTHHDPSRRHASGYLVHNGRTYQ
jgi:hypothetical protein